MVEMDSALDQLDVDLYMEVGKGSASGPGFARSCFFWNDDEKALCPSKSGDCFV